MRFDNKDHDSMACAFFLISVPILAHLLFSRLGFCPTDDGWQLAFSRRLLDGQVPHRDFIAMRPVGTALLHAPFLLFGGNYTLWISRFFIWFQFACVAWIWTSVILKSLKIHLSVFEKLMLATIAFTLTSHTFPVMPFPTIDGLFFLSLGLALYSKGTPQNKTQGYIVMGIAYLCKQSFLPTILAYLFLLGDWRKLRFWIAAAIPGIIYFAYLLLVKAVPDAIFQLTAHADIFLSRGIKMYTFSAAVAWGILLGYLAAMLLFAQIRIKNLGNRIKLQKLLGTVTFFGMPLSLSIALSQSVSASWILCFHLFGVVLGTIVYFTLKGKEWISFARIGALVAVMGWSASLSIGYPAPGFSMGAAAVLFIAYCYAAFQETGRKNSAREFPLFLLILSFVINIISYDIARQKYIYEDKPAHELTKTLDDILPGGYLIKTNSDTYQFLIDFKKVLEKTKGRDFMIIPGLPIYWTKSLKKNPLPLDWVLPSELAGKRALIDRVLRTLDTHQGKTIVILGKIEPDYLAENIMKPVDAEMERYVRAHFSKMGETQFFELYQ